MIDIVDPCCLNVLIILPEDDPLRVETCGVTYNVNKVVK